MFYGKGAAVQVLFHLRCVATVFYQPLQDTKHGNLSLKNLFVVLSCCDLPENL